MSDSPGLLRPRNLLIAALVGVGQQVLSQVSQEEIASFANNMDKILPALERMAPGMQGMAGMQSMAGMAGFPFGPK